MRALSAVKVPLDQRKRTDNLQVERVCVGERETAKDFKWMFDCASVRVCVVEDFNHSEAQWESI